MSICNKCDSDRIVSINAKCSDLCTTTFNKTELNGYVPDDIGIGGGDCIEIDFCLSCGQIQSDVFPVDTAGIEKEDRGEYGDDEGEEEREERLEKQADKLRRKKEIEEDANTPAKIPAGFFRRSVKAAS